MRPTDNIPTWFRSTAIGRRLESEEQKEIAKGRKATAAELVELRKRLADGVGPLREAVVRADERVNVAQKRLDAEMVKGREARLQLSSFTLGLEGRINRLEAQLRETADPALDRFAEEIQSEIDRTCATGVAVEHSLERDLHSGRSVAIRSNKASINKRLEALRQIQQYKIPELRLQVGVDVDKEIEQLRRTVPAIESPGIPEPAAV
jgi:hypothetical protein